MVVSWRSSPSHLDRTVPDLSHHKADCLSVYQHFESVCNNHQDFDPLVSLMRCCKEL